jgi:hypothetical protein
MENYRNWFKGDLTRGGVTSAFGQYSAATGLKDLKWSPVPWTCRA